MYAMQYEITLPADYDMGIIRERIAVKGPLLDKFPGLGVKAYLIRERGIDGSPINQYAPFYLWASIDGMRRFLWDGGGFSAIVSSFGRPIVQHWNGIACVKNLGQNQHSQLPRRQRIEKSVGPDVDPAATPSSPPRANLVDSARDPGVNLAALAVDPRTWELVHFTLWSRDPPEDAGTRYQVLVSFDAGDRECRKRRVRRRACLRQGLQCFLDRVERLHRRFGPQFD